MNNRRAFRFENLEVWQKARVLNRRVYAVSRKFPEQERFALTSQIRRASISISYNIAEGLGRNSDTDFAHFLEIAYRSLMETISQLFLALDESYITESEFEEILSEADILAAQLVAFSKSLGRTPRINVPQKSRQ